MKNLGVVITDGVGFRNFILSDFIHEAKQNFGSVVILSCLPKAVYEDFNLDCKIIELEVFDEKFITWFFKKIKEIAHLHQHKKGNFGIQDNLVVSYSKSHTPRGYATHLAYWWSYFFNSEKWINWYNKLQQYSFAQKPVLRSYFKIIEQENLDILFFTHQRPSFIAPLIYVAEKLKIKTAAFIFSWDNLASKNRMAGNFDYFLVWSELMKNEMLQFYNLVNQDQISIVGTPQFEPFVNPKFGYEKNTLLAKFDLDQNKPIVFFTCNDASSKNDPIYLKLLAEFIVQKKLIKDINLIVRTSPAEEPLRFKEIADTYSFIVWNYPDWTIKRKNHLEAWTQRVPSLEDLNDLKSLLMHCDFNINILSTITLDSFIFNKPVINPVFGNKENGMFDDQKFLDYLHLSRLVESEGSLIVKNEVEFLNAVNFLLENKDNKATERSNFIDLQLGKPLVGTGKRIAEQLRIWANK
jgi:hypothetical protein